MSQENAYAIVDDSAFPMVTITFTGHQPSEENFQAYLDQTFHLYDRQQELAIVFDATHATLPGFTYQKKQANWLKEHTPLMQQYCRGTAYIIPNPIIGGILNGIFALQKQPAPYKIFRSLEEGKQWTLSQLHPTSF